jgi:tetratricopeptide (TPR) repeat protein
MCRPTSLTCFAFVLLCTCLVLGRGAVTVPVATAIEEATAQIAQGQLIDAETTLTPLVGKKADATALYLMSRVRMGQMRYAEAVEFAERAVKADQSKAIYFCQLGSALVRHSGEVGSYEGESLTGKARKAYEKALALDPKSSDALLGLIHFYLYAPPALGGNLDKALQYAKKLREVDPVAGELELAAITLTQGDFAGAAVHFEAADKLKPGNAGLHVGWSRALYKLGRKEEAKAQLQEALKIDPNYPDAKKVLEAIDKPESSPKK